VNQGSVTSRQQRQESATLALYRDSTVIRLVCISIPDTAKHLRMLGTLGSVGRRSLPARTAFVSHLLLEEFPELCLACQSLSVSVVITQPGAAPSTMVFGGR